MAARDTSQIPIPKSPIEQIIGQDEAIRIAKIVSKQKRHLLLVGPPGTGKSMIAQAVASLIPKPTQEISVLHNFERPERPIIEVRVASEIKNERLAKALGRVVSASEIPLHVAEKLGFRCRRCGAFSFADSAACPKCGADKYRKEESPFDDLIANFDTVVQEDRVQTTHMVNGREQVVVFERAGRDKARVLSQQELQKLQRFERTQPRKVIVPITRSTFVQATGASETELLGDVRHDPYGGHEELGTQPYTRIVPGAVHEAHEGVLFIDELSSIGYLQRFLLTAMQEKKYPIAGRNASSTGASVKVDSVPCDFMLIGAVNINDLAGLLPPLRSRILGNGYEVLVSTHMPDTDGNRKQMLQFISQEIRKDGRIPHASIESANLIIEEAARRARSIDNVSGLTLRLRGISGIIKLAGDMASSEGSKLIEPKHVKEALVRGKSVEEQLGDKYENWWKAGMSDFGASKKKGRDSEVG
jgi:ATP-dependent Lon protease